MSKLHEVTIILKLRYAIEAINAAEAIELARQQDPHLIETMAPEVITINAKCIGKN
jgi:hypothetical protein